MLRAKLSAVSTFLLGLCVLALTACSSTPTDKTAAMAPAAIYKEAQDEMASGQWERAIPLLEKLEARAAGSPMAQQAQLDKAYCQYKGSEGVQAIATLDRFMKLHPVSPAMDYALYLKGLVNFNDDLGLFSAITGQDLSERDQKAAKESFETFRELTTRFPDSKYSVDARQRMQYTVGSLAKNEVHIARYYYTRGAYLAAINRAQAAVTDYREVPALEEAMYILYKSYDALGMAQLRDDAKRVLDKTYPNSIYLTKGFQVKSEPWWKVW